MPTFLVTAPDGRKYRVNGPEGSTQEQAVARVRKQLSAPQNRNLPKPPPPNALNSLRNKVQGLAGQVFEGFLPGWGDEVSGAGEVLRHGTRVLAGQEEWAPGKAFDKGQERYDANVKNFRRENPGTSAAGTAMGMAGSFALPTVKVAQGVGAGARMGNAAANGALYGALAGAGEGDGLAERLGNTVEGSAVGGMGSAAFSAASGPARGVYRTARDIAAPLVSKSAGRKVVEKAAERRLGTVLADSGTTPADAAQLAADRQSKGVPAVLSDTNDATRQTTGWASRGIGPGQAAVREAITKRQSNMASRVRSHIDETLGSTADPNVQSGRLSDKARADAKPLYEEAYSIPGRTSPELEAMLATPAGRQALSRARTIAANERRNPNEMGFDLNEQGEVVLTSVPSAQTLDYVKRGMDDVLEEFRDGTTGRLMLDEGGRAVNNLRSDLVKELDALNPAYGEARAAFAGPMADRQALKLGLEDVQGSTRRTVPDARHQMEGMTDPELDQFRLGDRTRLADEINGTKSGVRRWGDATAPINANDTRMALVREIHGDEAAAKLFERTDAERAGHLTYKEVYGNSSTAARQAVDAEMTPEAAVQAAKGNWQAAMYHMLNRGYANSFGRFEHGVKDEVARMMTAEGPQGVNRAVSRITNRATADAAFADKLARANSQGAKFGALQIVGNSGDETGMYGPTDIPDDRPRDGYGY